MAYDAGKGASGAATGAMVGSAIPGIGTLVGGLIGGTAGFFKTKKKKPKKYSTLDPQQQQLYQGSVDSIYGNGPFSDLYNYDADAANQNFDQMYARPAYRGFQENMIPSITGQYRKGNLMQSSYSGEALSRAGRDVQEGLDSQRANMIYQGTQAADQRKYDAINRIMSMQTFAYDRPESSSSAIDQILATLGPQAGQWIANKFNV